MALKEQAEVLMIAHFSIWFRTSGFILTGDHLTPSLAKPFTTTTTYIFDRYSYEKGQNKITTYIFDRKVYLLKKLNQVGMNLIRYYSYIFIGIRYCIKWNAQSVL
uniref:Uncharacterized protein n=1 Tax=Cacopsylla melanoneura TaxID=428564 RepID=A0A8D9EEV2_9HEMI